MSVSNEKYKEVFFCSALYFLRYVDVHMKIDLCLTDTFSHMLFRYISIYVKREPMYSYYRILQKVSTINNSKLCETRWILRISSEILFGRILFLKAASLLVEFSSLLLWVTANGLAEAYEQTRISWAELLSLQLSKFPVLLAPLCRPLDAEISSSCSGLEFKSFVAVVSLGGSCCE